MVVKVSKITTPKDKTPQINKQNAHNINKNSTHPEQLTQSLSPSRENATHVGVPSRSDILPRDCTQCGCVTVWEGVHVLWTMCSASAWHVTAGSSGATVAPLSQDLVQVTITLTPTLFSSRECIGIIMILWKYVRMCLYACMYYVWVLFECLCMYEKVLCVLKNGWVAGNGEETRSWKKDTNKCLHRHTQMQ